MPSRLDARIDWNQICRKTHAGETTDPTEQMVVGDIDWVRLPTFRPRSLRAPPSRAGVSLFRQNCGRSKRLQTARKTVPSPISFGPPATQPPWKGCCGDNHPVAGNLPWRKITPRRRARARAACGANPYPTVSAQSEQASGRTDRTMISGKAGACRQGWRPERPRRAWMARFPPD
jgi:hypothetical protein